MWEPLVQTAGKALKYKAFCFCSGFFLNLRWEVDLLLNITLPPTGGFLQVSEKTEKPLRAPCWVLAKSEKQG
jgi:hypothetical protein